MTHQPIRHVADMATDVAWLARNMPTVLAVLSRDTPDGWPAGTLGGGGGSGVSMPTEAAAIAGLYTRTQYATIAGLASEARGLVAQLVAAVQDVSVEVDTSAAQRQSRCTGGEGEWADPSCTRNAVTRDGLCDACRQRRDYWRRKETAA